MNLDYSLNIFKVNTLPSIVQTGVGTTLALYLGKNITMPAAAVYCAVSSLVEQIGQNVFKQFEYGKYIAGAVAGAGAGYLSVYYLFRVVLEPQNVVMLSAALLALRIIGDNWDFLPRARS